MDLIVVRRGHEKKFHCNINTFPNADLEVQLTQLYHCDGV